MLRGKLRDYLCMYPNHVGADRKSSRILAGWELLCRNGAQEHGFAQRTAQVPRSEEQILSGLISDANSHSLIIIKSSCKDSMISCLTAGARVGVLVLSKSRGAMAAVLTNCAAYGRSAHRYETDGRLQTSYMHIEDDDSIIVSSSPRAACGFLECVQAAKLLDADSHT
jgi:hypothetical protein